MSRGIRTRLVLVDTVLASSMGMTSPYAEVGTPQPGTSKVKPKPLSYNVNRGLAYLVSQQDASGGWGQGGGWRTGSQGGRVEGASVADPPDVGNTCIATLALFRAGNTPNQ